MEQLEKTCVKIQDLLVRRSLQTLSEAEEKAITAHTGRCEQCRHFAQVLTKMSSTARLDRDAARPTPAIRRRLFAAAPKKSSTFANWLDAAAGLLRYRIPLYQILIAFSILTALFFYAGRFDPAKEKAPPAGSPVVLSAEGVLALRNLQWLEGQKIGQSIREDTLITQWLYSL